MAESKDSRIQKLQTDVERFQKQLSVAREHAIDLQNALDDDETILANLIDEISLIHHEDQVKIDRLEREKQAKDREIDLLQKTVKRYQDKTIRKANDIAEEQINSTVSKDLLQISDKQRKETKSTSPVVRHDRSVFDTCNGKSFATAISIDDDDIKATNAKDDSITAAYKMRLRIAILAMLKKANLKYPDNKGAVQLPGRSPAKNAPIECLTLETRLSSGWYRTVGDFKNDFMDIIKGRTLQKTGLSDKEATKLYRGVLTELDVQQDTMSSKKSRKNNEEEELPLAIPAAVRKRFFGDVEPEVGTISAKKFHVDEDSFVFGDI